GNNDADADDLEIVVRDGIADQNPADTITTNTTAAYDVVVPTFSKTVTQSPNAGGTTNAIYSIVLTMPSSIVDVPANGVVISDTFTPANGSVLTTAVSNNPDVVCTVPTATTFSCTNSAGPMSADESVTITVNADVPANNGNAAISHCNDATLTVTLAAPGGVYSVTDNDRPGNCASQVQVGSATQGLVHISATGAVEAMRDHNNNVIGYRHTVCALNDSVDAIWPNVIVGASNNFQIKTISGTSTISAPVVSTPVDCDLDGQIDDSTVSWYSTSTGEQEVTVVNDAGSTLYGWNEPETPVVTPNPLETGSSTVALVKEWNTLAPTWITSPGAVSITEGTGPDDPDTISGTNLDGTSVSVDTTLNSVYGIYMGSSLPFYESPIATHANAAGTQLSIAYGAKVTFTRAASSTCGAIILDGTNGVDYLWVSGPEVGSISTDAKMLDQSTDKIVVTSLGVGIPFHFEAGVGASWCSGTTGSIQVNIQVDYPTLLGSDQPPSPALETLTVNWHGTLAAKQVFLAWAGQRVILEHDWRVAKVGDRDGDVATGIGSPIPLGVCPFQGQTTITYIKGGGPGNFLPGSGVNLNGSDQAIVSVDFNDNSQTDGEDVINNMNGMCISRVLFESEQPGQVDVEAFGYWGGQNTTKHAFVIYYMKFNTINVSLVTQVSKPNHNSSAYPDYADSAGKGNPWDASADDADNAAEWNVSRDLLVRGRVTGFFNNENPSGRARDDSNPLNILPADRWVMPDDWALLAGGPKDNADGTDIKGTAEEFRPYYDIMFAPNNGVFALGRPEGTSANIVAQVVTVAGVTNTAAAFRVNTCADFAGVPNKAALVVGANLAATFISCANGLLTIGGATTTPAAGTNVSLVSGVPFEGPYSTIDVKGLAAQGLGGAALSDIDPNNIRDASKGDGDVDWWDAPMPVAPISVQIRDTGFIKQVLKQDVYYNGSASGSNSIAGQSFPNGYYFVDIPASPFIPAAVLGGGYFWDTWSTDGPGGLGDRSYQFWEPAMIGTNSEGWADTTVTAAQNKELAAIRAAYGDDTIARDLVVFSDNHGEFMVTANGDFKTDLTACTTNVLAAGHHCAPGDHVGTGTIRATAEYPDFRGKHFPVLSNAATVTWTWGGYKDVTVVKGDTDQFKYVVFHAMDRDGFCSPPTGAVLLHPVLSSLDDDNVIGSVDPVENVDFLIDSGEGIIVDSSSGATTPPINDGKQFATGLYTFSTALNDPAVTGLREFDPSPLADATVKDECQAWIKVSNSLLGVINILAIAHDDEGNIGFDKIIDLTNTTSYTL
ncbi:MAG: hypothetical protein WBO97_14730, partial [Tepidiformaceae bacterium]